MISIVIHSEPDIVYYRGARPADVDIARPRLIALGSLRAGIRPQSSETANLTATLDNADGELTTEVAEHVMLREATVYRDGTQVFSGTVTRISIGAELRLEIEA